MMVLCLCAEETRMKPVGSKMHAVAGILYYQCPHCGARVKISQAWESPEKTLETYLK